MARIKSKGNIVVKNSWWARDGSWHDNEASNCKYNREGGGRAIFNCIYYFPIF